MNAQRFSERRKGYDKAEVEEFVRRLSEDSLRAEAERDREIKRISGELDTLAGELGKKSAECERLAEEKEALSSLLAEREEELAACRAEISVYAEAEEKYRQAEREHKAETASLLSKIEKYEKQAARQAESCAVLEEKAAAYDRLLEDVGREMRSKPDTYRSEAGGIQRQPASQDEKQRPCRSSRQKKDGIVRVFRRLMENDRDI